jgi:hypothetical protein
VTHRSEPLAPCFIERGTVTEHIDMMRALDTVEGLRFRQLVDGKLVAEGEATLVKLSADDTSTMLVNGCLFLNVTSFRYLTFENPPGGACRFELVREGMSFVIEPRDEPRTDDGDAIPRRAAVRPFDAFVIADDDDLEEP